MTSDRKRTGAHFTPPRLAEEVARRLVKRLEDPRTSGRILDPACGSGNLLVAVANAMPDRVRDRFTLVGIESDGRSLETARRRLASLDGWAFQLRHGDYLDIEPEPVEAIVANPPYVRTQVLGADRSRDLATRFGLEGRIDLYQVFLAAMVDHLTPGGVLGTILSNRFLTVKAGAATRRALRTWLDDLEIVDLGDTKPFKAAVLPALLFGTRRQSPRENGRPVRITFERRYEESCAAGLCDLPASDVDPWPLVTPDERAWIDRVDSAAVCRFGDVAKIRVGVKTTADRVFVRNDWDELPEDERPRDGDLRPILTREDLHRWRALPEGKRRVLYTHELHEGRRRPIPFDEDSSTWRYLLSCRETLQARTYLHDAGRRWYEIWVPQDPAAWASPKIVFPDINAEARFCLDRDGRLVQGNCYWITTNDPRDEDILLLMLGVANSTLMTRYHDLLFRNRLYSGRRRYLTQYVARYPLPDPAHPASREIVERVRSLCDRSTPAERMPAMEKELNDRVEVALSPGRR